MAEPEFPCPSYSASTSLQQPWPTLWKGSPCPGSWSWTRCPCPCPRSSASRPSPAPPPPRRSAFDEMQGCSSAWRTEFSIFGIVTHPGGWKKCKSSNFPNCVQTYFSLCSPFEDKGVFTGGVMTPGKKHWCEGKDTIHTAQIWFSPRHQSSPECHLRCRSTSTHHIPLAHIPAGSIAACKQPRKVCKASPGGKWKGGYWIPALENKYNVYLIIVVLIVFVVMFSVRQTEPDIFLGIRIK